MENSGKYVGLDVGGTTTKAAVVDDFGSLLTSPVALPTEPERGSDLGLQVMAEAIRRAVAAAGLSMDDVTAIGVATPGSMDIPAGLILDPPNLKPWRNVPVRQFIAEQFRKPTALQNDANAAAYGESWIGCGCGLSSFVMFTLGTGIGGGVILDGKIVEGQHSHAGELGHIKIAVTDSRLCGCGQRGCLEAYASATAVVARTREALAGDGSKSSLGTLSTLTARDVFRASDEGDRLAATVVDDTARYLAIGAATVMHVLDPDAVAFGGGMAQAGDRFIARIRDFVQQFAFPTPAQRCEIRQAVLGGDAGIIGAARCARQLWPR
jgi:glucokinase